MVVTSINCVLAQIHGPSITPNVPASNLIGIGTNNPSGAALHIFTGINTGQLPPLFKLERNDGTNQGGLLSIGISSNGFSSPSGILGGGSAYFKLEDPFGNSPNRDMGFSTNGSAPQLVIKNSGFVGIGTANPTAKFHSIGTARFESLPSSTTNTSIITADANGNLSTRSAASFLTASSTAWDLSGNTITGTEWLGTQNNYPLEFRTNGGFAALINTAGDMGIGTASPTARLEVTALPFGATGIKGFGVNNGVFGEAYHMNAALTEYGINAGWSEAIGVFGKGTYNSTTGNGNIYGVAGSAAGQNPLNNIGVYGEAKNANGYNTGVIGYINSPSGIFNSGTVGQVELNTTALWNRAVYGISPVAPNHFAGYFEGKVAIVDGSEANNFVLTCDATGLATWKDPCMLCPGGSGTAWNTTGNTATPTDFLGTTNAEDLRISTNGVTRATVTAGGEVLIGNVLPTAIPLGDYKLFVEQGIVTEGLLITPYTSLLWPDYVFEETYPLRPLEELEAYIQENKHLPNIPSAKEIATSGIDVAKMQAQQLEKIEELTLYMLAMKKEIDLLKKENETLKNNKSPQK